MDEILTFTHFQPSLHLEWSRGLFINGLELEGEILINEEASPVTLVHVFPNFIFPISPALFMYSLGLVWRNKMREITGKATHPPRLIIKLGCLYWNYPFIDEILILFPLFLQNLQNQDVYITYGAPC